MFQRIGLRNKINFSHNFSILSGLSVKNQTSTLGGKRNFITIPGPSGPILLPTTNGRYSYDDDCNYCNYCNNNNDNNNNDDDNDRMKTSIEIGAIVGVIGLASSICSKYRKK